MQPIDDPSDPRVDDYRHLTDADARRAIESSGNGQGIFVVEGPVALEQLLRSTHRIRSVLVTPTRARSLGDLDRTGAPVYVAPRAVLEQVTGFDVHRGVLAAADRPAPRSPAEVAGSTTRLVVLEGVSDNENVGSVFRNAAALGIGGVLLDGACTDPLYRRSIRVSSGWTMRIPFARVERTTTLLDEVRSLGYRTVALTPSAEAVDVDRAGDEGHLDDPVALVVGAEGPGLSPATVARCDLAVRVPMSGEVDSLNVATSLAVVAAFAAARRCWT